MLIIQTRKPKLSQTDKCCDQLATQFPVSCKINRIRQISWTVYHIRRFYSVYPQIGNEIRRTVSVELSTAIPQAISAELEGIPAKVLLHKLPYSRLLLISGIEEPLKRNFYEMESIKGNWLTRPCFCVLKKEILK
jgi:hypothetical protein